MGGWVLQLRTHSCNWKHPSKEQIAHQEETEGGVRCARRMLRRWEAQGTGVGHVDCMCARARGACCEET